MNEIVNAVKEVATFFITVIKPGCEAVLKHPLFQVLALPATIIGLIAGAKALWNWLLSRD